MVRVRVLVAAAIAAAVAAAPAEAYLFWHQPALKGDPVTGAEPGVAAPLPGATPKEVRANLLWALRAGLNVAALQCQFAPALMTPANYNVMLGQHAPELMSAYQAIGGYFKRTSAKTWQTALDQYTTRTYNGFSTLRAQLEFCETAASIGRDAVATKRGALVDLAVARMREFRNSLVFAGDTGLAYHPERVPDVTPPQLVCADRRGYYRPCKS